MSGNADLQRGSPAEGVAAHAARFTWDDVGRAGVRIVPAPRSSATIVAADGARGARRDCEGLTRVVLGGWSPSASRRRGVEIEQHIRVFGDIERRIPVVEATIASNAGGCRKDPELGRGVARPRRADSKRTAARRSRPQFAGRLHRPFAELWRRARALRQPHRGGPVHIGRNGPYSRRQAGREAHAARRPARLRQARLASLGAAYILVGRH